jgi:hypothetical protein
MIALGVSLGNLLSNTLFRNGGGRLDLTGTQDVGALAGEGVLKSTAVAGFLFNALSSATLLPTMAFHRWLLCMANATSAAASNAGDSQLRIQFADVGMDTSWLPCANLAGLQTLFTSNDLVTSTESAVKLFVDFATTLVSGLGETLLFAQQLSLTATIDYCVALAWSIQDLLYTFNMRACKVPNYAMRYVLRCGCNDAPYHIPDVQRGQKWNDGALWCSGTLSMVLKDGTNAFVYNPYSLSELSKGVQGLTKYIQCLSESANPDSACPPPPREQLTLSVLVQQGVEPIAVWARCKSNYALSMWDVGAGALFVAPPDGQNAQDPVPVSVRAQAVQWARARPDGPALLACLQDPARLQLGYEACLTGFFGAQGYTKAAYFLYTDSRSSSSSTVHEGEPPDACRVFTGLEAAAAPGTPLQTLMTDCIMQDGVGNVVACDLNPLVRGADTHLAVAAIHGTTPPPAASLIEGARALYAPLNRTLRAAFERFTSKFGEEAEDIDALLFSADGDLLHQFFDCLYLGPYTRVDLHACDAEVRVCVVHISFFQN